MKEKQFVFEFKIFNSIDELTLQDAQLLSKAREVTQYAYAPYSKFFVGAAALLGNGEIVTGTNQENASYPAGICAERVLLSAISSLHPQMPVKTIAVTYQNNNGESNRPVSPCGICRQSLLEYESHTNQTIQLILSGMQGEVYLIPNAKSLLPLSFMGDDMK